MITYSFLNFNKYQTEQVHGFFFIIIIQVLYTVTIISLIFWLLILTKQHLNIKADVLLSFNNAF